ncbi:hypothetical protein [Streptomyces sp. NBC_01506]|uniref:hypothetical protein n=1 Tax=Streptomyces sp. NBC_01506 TaxID=2903887 RepID=UPI003870C960
MGITAILRSVNEEQLTRARRDPSYAARLVDEIPEDDSAQRRTFYIERFSFNLWESLVWDAPVNVFTGEEEIDLNWDYEDEAEAQDDADEGDDDEDSTAMRLDPGLMTELAGWLRDIRFADACEGSGEAFTVDDGYAYDSYGSVDEDEFNDFRAFVLAVAERGDGVLFHFS